MSIIESHNLTKSFSKSRYDWRRPFSVERTKKIAVKDLSLAIEEGEFIGFLGPNGAGKTTYLKMLSGIIYPESGTAKVLGYVPWERDYAFLRQIAIVMGQKNQLWWDLPAIDSYKMLKEVYSIPEAKFKRNLDLMVDTLGMTDIVNHRLRNMSLGERMKCELVASLLHDPKVIFLDEPTIGLDVVSSQAIRDFLRRINQEKKTTMILTSHYMGDIEALCKRVVITNRGEKIYDGGLSELKEKYAPMKKIEIYLATVDDRKKFSHLPMKKQIIDGKGIIEVKKSKLGGVVTQVFTQFLPENISVSDPDTEEVISKMFLAQK